MQYRSRSAWPVYTICRPSVGPYVECLRDSEQKVVVCAVHIFPTCINATRVLYDSRPPSHVRPPSIRSVGSRPVREENQPTASRVRYESQSADGGNGQGSFVENVLRAGTTPRESSRGTCVQLSSRPVNRPYWGFRWASRMKQLLMAQYSTCGDAYTYSC